MEKERFNFCISIKNKNLIKQVAKQNKVTMGQIINALIEQKLADPIKVIKDKRKELLIQVNKLDDDIKRLEGKKEVD